MQLKIKSGQLFTKKNFLAFVSTILFIGCAAFVAFRGYKCFDKYLKRPQHSEISIQLSKNHPFPSFTLCLSKKDSYNTDLLKKCQLNPVDYIWRAKWVGKGGINCTDPKILHSKAVANYEDLEMELIQILTHVNDAGSSSFISNRPSNWSFVEWKAVPILQNKRCFTLSLPDNIVREGISLFFIRSKVFDTLYLHKEGTLLASMSGLISSVSVKYADLYRASVTHESIEQLNYDGKHCNNDAEYNHDKCKEDYIYKV